MDTKVLKTFLALAQTPNYQSAAEQLNYAPSTLFKHIQLLEAELGCALFVKSGRELVMTAKAQAFEPIARRILDNYQLALQISTEQECISGAITIGGCEMNTANGLLDMLTKYSQTYPQVRLSMMTSPNAAVPELLRNGLIDAGYYYMMNAKGIPGLQGTVLYQQPLYLMTAPDHPLAAKSKVRYADLEGANLVHPHDNCCFIVELLKRLEYAGTAIGSISYVGGVQVVIEHILKEGAVGLIPHDASQRFEETCGLVRLNVDEEPLYFWETILYKNFESLRPCVRRLVEHSRRFSENMLMQDHAGVLIAPSSLRV